MAVRVVTVVGARPQFIKAAAVSRAIAAHNASRPDDAIEELLVHTGQHYDENMSAAFFAELELAEPAFHLGVGSGSHAYQTGEVLKRLERVVAECRPDVMVVYGDTNSTLGGALVSAKARVPLAHGEAGLRSGNRRMAEEVNRIVTDRLSDQLYCPSAAAVANLAREGITNGVFLVGDVMFDVLRWTMARPATDVPHGDQDYALGP